MLSNCFVSVLDVSSNVAFACRNKKRERKVRSIRTISNWKRFDRARQRTEWPPPRENISFCLDTTIHERPFKFKFIYIQAGQFGHKTIPPPGKYVLTVFASVAVRHDSKSWTELTDQNLNLHSLPFCQPFTLENNEFLMEKFIDGDRKLKYSEFRR